MDAVARFGEPVRVSPFIKFCRWSMLFVGIAYGYNKNRFLQNRADRLKNHREQRKADRLVFEKAEKERIGIENTRYLEDITGAKFTKRAEWKKEQEKKYTIH